MGVYPMGEAIRRIRESRGMTREELSDGICEIGTLKRIECGRQVPSRANFIALMERLGKNGNRYLPFIHSNDIEMYLKREKLENMLARGKIKEAEIYLIEFEQKLDLRDKINLQFVKQIRVLIEYSQRKINRESRRSGLMEALCCTIPEYREGDALNGFFSHYEIRLFCNLALSFKKENKFDTAIDMLQQLERYFAETRIDQNERAENEVFVLLTFAMTLEKMGRLEEGLRFNEQARRLSVRMNKVEKLPIIINNIAEDKEMLGEESEVCLDFYLQAYFVAELCGEHGMMEITRRHIKEYGREDIIE